MTSHDLMDLARRLAAIASQTNDPETSQQLLDVVERLLTANADPASRIACSRPVHRSKRCHKPGRGQSSRPVRKIVLR